MEEEVRMKAIIKGQVQGVFFRAWTRRKAEALELRGYVKNLDDGSVEVVVEGERGVVERLLEHLKTGPRLAEVGTVNAEYSQVTGEFDGFDVEK